MVADSHHWLKAVGLLPSNFAGFSIFNLDVRIWASLTGCPVACAAAIPAPTSWAISPGVSMVASWSWVGSLAPGGGLTVGRFRSYRSLSPSLGGDEGDGNAPLRGGLGGGPCGGFAAGTAGDAGTARGLGRRRWVPPNRGLPSTNWVGGALRLGAGRASLAGVAGKGTVVATCSNSSCAWASHCYRPAIRSRSSFHCRLRHQQKN